MVPQAQDISFKEQLVHLVWSYLVNGMCNNIFIFYQHDLLFLFSYSVVQKFLI